MNTDRTTTTTPV